MRGGNGQRRGTGCCETLTLNGWMGPRWMRSGWFQAYRLLADGRASRRRRRGHASRSRLAATTWSASTSSATSYACSPACRALVAGFTVKREYFNAAFSAGIENIGFDALRVSARRCSCAP